MHLRGEAVLELTQITPTKVARYLPRLKGPVRPPHWDVDPSTVCDHTCRGCPYIYEDANVQRDPMLGVLRQAVEKSRRGFLDYDLFREFVHQARGHGCEAITFVGGGEPTMHPRFADMIESVRAQQIKFGVVTHFGRKYDDDLLTAMSHATWVRISVNAGTPSTYEKHQGRNHFHQMLENTARLAQLDGPGPTSGPNVGWSFLITNDNYDEIFTAIDLCKSLGCSYIQFKPIIEHPKLGAAYVGLEDEIASRLRAAEKLATEDFQVLNQWNPRFEELRRHERGEFNGPCYQQRFNPKLGADGVVYFCCELAYSTEAALGSLRGESLEHILEVAANRAPDMKDCPHCWFKPLNEVINVGGAATLVAPPDSSDAEFV